MTAAMHDRRQTLQEMEPRLLVLARALTHDDAEAHALVSETLTAAGVRLRGSSDVADMQVWVFRLLRERSHSLERGQDYRRSKRSLTAEREFTRKRLLLAQAQTQPAGQETGGA